MARARFALGVMLSVLVATFAVWDQQVAWMSPVLLSVPIILLWIYAIAGTVGLDGRKTLGNAAFGLALFGGADLLIGAGKSGSQLLSHMAMKPLHVRAFNAIQGTHLKGDETNPGFLSPPDPMISQMISTRTATLYSASLLSGLLGAVICVILGHISPLPRWRRSINLGLIAAGIAGIVACFVWPGWWSVTLAFQVMCVFWISVAVAARYGPVSDRAKLFCMALLGGVCFILGSYRNITPPFYWGWMADPIGTIVIKIGLWREPEITSGIAPHVVVGYMPSPDSLWARIRLGMLFATIPVGLMGVGLAMIGSWAGSSARRRLVRLTGTSILMAIVAASAIVMMAFRSPEWPWSTMESQMIAGLTILAACLARFRSGRGRMFFAGFAVFGLVHVAMISSGLRWSSPFIRPATKVAVEIWQSIHGDPFSINEVSDPSKNAQATPNNALYSGTIDVAMTTSSLGMALCGGSLFALMIPAGRRTGIETREQGN